MSLFRFLQGLTFATIRQRVELEPLANHFLRIKHTPLREKLLFRSKKEFDASKLDPNRPTQSIRNSPDERFVVLLTAQYQFSYFSSFLRVIFGDRVEIGQGNGFYAVPSGSNKTKSISIATNNHVVPQYVYFSLLHRGWIDSDKPKLRLSLLSLRFIEVTDHQNNSFVVDECNIKRHQTEDLAVLNVEKLYASPYFLEIDPNDASKGDEIEILTNIRSYGHPKGTFIVDNMSPPAQISHGEIIQYFRDTSTALRGKVIEVQKNKFVHSAVTVAGMSGAVGRHTKSNKAVGVHRRYHPKHQSNEAIKASLLNPML